MEPSIPRDHVPLAEVSHHFGTVADGCLRLRGFHLMLVGLPSPSLHIFVSHFRAVRVGLGASVMWLVGFCAYGLYN